MREDGGEYLDINYPVKTHEEILTLIEEIKAYEQWVQTGVLPEPSQPTTDDMIELPGMEEEFPEWDCVESEMEGQEPPSLLDAKDGASPALKRQRSTSSVKSSVFHLRFDEGGNLINVDLRTPKESTALDTAKNKLLQKLHRKKEKTEGESEETLSKTSKIKAGLGKVGKLKKLIPKRNKEPEVTEEDLEEEEEDEDW